MAVSTLQAKRDERRDSILDAARDCFLAEGYGHTSMSSIAARLGGSKGTLYNYFKSKEELFDAFVRRGCSELAEAIFEAPDPKAAPRDRLVQLARAFLTLLLSPQAMSVHRLVVGEGDRFPELGRAFYAAGPKTVLARMSQELKPMMDAGVLRKADPDLAAHQFKDLTISGVYQLRMWGVIDDPSPAQLDAQAKTAVDTFMRAYRPD